MNDPLYLALVFDDETFIHSVPLGYRISNTTADTASTSVTFTVMSTLAPFAGWEFDTARANTAGGASYAVTDVEFVAYVVLLNKPVTLMVHAPVLASWAIGYVRLY